MKERERASKRVKESKIYEQDSECHSEIREERMREKKARQSERKKMGKKKERKRIKEDKFVSKFFLLPEVVGQFGSLSIAPHLDIKVNVISKFFLFPLSLSLSLSLSLKLILEL